MNLIIAWIKDNILMFFVVDFIFLILNVSILNYIRNGSIINFDLVLVFFISCGFFCMLFFMTTAWTRVTDKFHYLFIQIGGIGKVLSYIGIILFLLLNIISIPLMWLDSDSLNNSIIFYFSTPWLILISTIMYDKHTWKKL